MARRFTKELSFSQTIAIMNFIISNVLDVCVPEIERRSIGRTHFSLKKCHVDVPMRNLLHTQNTFYIDWNYVGHINMMVRSIRDFVLSSRRQFLG